MQSCCSNDKEEKQNETDANSLRGDKGTKIIVRPRVSIFGGGGQGLFFIFGLSRARVGSLASSTPPGRRRCFKCDQSQKIFIDRVIKMSQFFSHAFCRGTYNFRITELLR